MLCSSTVISIGLTIIKKKYFISALAPKFEAFLEFKKSAPEISNIKKKWKTDEFKKSLYSLD